MQSSWPTRGKRVYPLRFCEVQGTDGAAWRRAAHAWSAHGQPLLLLGRAVRQELEREPPLVPLGGADQVRLRPRGLVYEGYEETMGLFGTPAELARRVDRKAWKHKGGVTLLLPVDHDPNLPRYFRNMYKYARRCRGGACPEGWYEKTHVRWVPLARVHQLDLRPEFRYSLPSLRRYFSAHPGRQV